MLKVFVFGERGAGKSELIKQLVSPSYVSPIGLEYKPTKFITFSAFGIDSGLIQVWEHQKDSTNKGLASAFAKELDVGIYCIDLSKRITGATLLKIEKEIKAFKEHSPHAEFIIAGTRRDKAKQSEEEINQLMRKLTIPFISTSACAKHGSIKLNDFLVAEAKKMNRIIRVRNRFPKDSELYNILDKLHNEVKRLKLADYQIEELGKLVVVFIGRVEKTKKLEEVAQAVEQFNNACNDRLSDKYHNLKALCFTFATTLLLTVAAAAIGFGVGFALSAWTGPFAFLSAVAVGSSAAMYVLAGTAATCAVTSLAAGYGFFRQPVLNATNNFADHIAATKQNGI